MNVEVALPLTDQADLDADRTALHLLLDPKRTHDHIHARASVITAGGKPNLCQLIFVRDSRTLRLETLALDPRARAFDGTVQKVRQRLIDHPEHAPALDRQADLDREISVARNKAARPVHRINHPDAPLG